MFKVALTDGKSVSIDADGFKTTDSGQLVMYAFVEDDRNRTVAVFAAGAWAYFKDDTLD